MAGLPIFVTGANRSGTTWMGNVLSQAADVAYVHEPFSPSLDPAVSRIPTRAHFTYGTALDPVQRAALDRLLAGRLPNPSGWRRDITARKPFGMGVREVGRALDRRRRRVLIKDPTACLLSPAVQAATGGPVVFMVRRPAGPPRLAVPAARGDGRRPAGDPPPVYEQLGLAWTPEVVRAVERDNVRAPSKDIAPAEFRTVVRQSSATVDTWRSRLDDDQAATIRSRTEAVASHFYDHA